MSLPAYIQPGFVSIYGLGSNIGTSGIGAPSQFLFGTIDQIGESVNNIINVGDSVLFNASDITCILTYSNWPYTIVPQAKLVITEQVPLLL